MFNLNLPGVLILFCIFRVLLLQQIFENDGTGCEYVNNNITDKQDIKMKIKNKLWNITGIGRNSALRVLLSPCGDPLPSTIGCGSGVVVCIINARTLTKSIINAGTNFYYTIDPESGKTILRSLEGQRCSSDENYTVIVEFGCSPFMKASPTFLYKDDCELRIGMMKSTCTPSCTTRIDNNLVDLRALQSLGSTTIEEPRTNRSFVIKFCNAAKECGDNGDATACDISNGNNIAIAGLNQRISYDSHINAIVVKSYFPKTKTQQRKNMEIYIKCNWDVQGIANIRYIVPSTQGKTYTFQGESSAACVKLPMDCVIEESYENNWVYNLTSLNKANKHWKVKNVNFGNIFINICGPLSISQQNHNCADQYSQVCYINGTGNFVNLGSIPFEFRVIDDQIEGKFVDGGICSINLNLTYSTEIEFLCNSIEKGPVMNAINNCTYKIKWETPAACSKQFITSEDCILSDVTGTINLNSMHRSSDSVYSFSDTSYIWYNLCGSLNQPCNNNKDVSICYINNDIEYIAGFSSKKLTRDNALLSLTLKGDKCDSRAIRMTKVYFHCNHSAPSDGNVRINRANENCLLEMNIDSPLACILPTFSKCVVYNDNIVYDLTPLMFNNSNYLVPHGILNVVYIMNVCHSVINFGDSLCPPGAGVCMNNLTEPHMKHKFLSLGNVNSRSVPTIENGNLVMHYTAGSYCPQADSLKHSTVIRFYCSNYEEGPRFFKKDICSHEFIWHTPTACGKQILSVKTRETDTVCKYQHPHTGKIIDLSNIQKILQIDLESGEFYKFSICENNYTHCTSNGTDCEIKDSKIQILSTKTIPYLEYSLKNHCLHSNSQANKLQIYLICSNLTQGNEYFNFTGISDCVLHINLLTNFACTSKESAVPLSVPTIPEVVIETVKIQNVKHQTTVYNTKIEDSTNTTLVPHISTSANIIPQVTAKIMDNSSTSTGDNKPLLHYSPKTSKQTDCIIKSTKTSSELNLKDIKTINVKSPTGFNYTVAMNEPFSNCAGYICKGSVEIVSKKTECPVIEFNDKDSMIKLLYKNNQVCDGSMFHSEIWLKCNSSVEQPSILREENCNVIITYPIQDACSLLGIVESHNSNAEIPIYSSVAVFVIAMLAIGVFFMVKKYPSKIFSRSCYQQIPDETENIVVNFKMKEM